MTNSTQNEDESRFQQLLASLQDLKAEVRLEAVDGLRKTGDARQTRRRLLPHRFVACSVCRTSCASRLSKGLNR